MKDSLFKRLVTTWASAALLGCGLCPVEARAESGGSAPGDNTGLSADLSASLGSLWAISPGEDQAQQLCTASYVGNAVWVTSQRCFPRTDSTYFLEGREGRRDAVDQVEVISPDRDIAFLRTKHELGAVPLSGADSFPQLEEEVVLLGFGEDTVTSRAVPSKLMGRLDHLETVEGWSFRHLFATSTTTRISSCRGDSGGPILYRGELVGVHTAGEVDHECTGEPGKFGAESYIDLASTETKEVLKRFSGPPQRREVSSESSEPNLLSSTKKAW